MDVFDIITYDYERVDSQMDLPDTWTKINEVITPDREIGVYEIGMAVHWVFDRTTKSAFIRFSLDGGNTWSEFTGEPKDKTDSNATYFAFPYENATDGGVIQVKVEIRKESGAGTLDVPRSAAWIKRVN
jgi:hypothetical protein